MQLLQKKKDLNYSLIILSQLCDDDYTVVLTKHDLVVYKNNKQILKELRSKTGDGLWDIPFSQNITSNFTSNISYPTSEQKTINIILRTDQRVTNLAA